MLGSVAWGFGFPSADFAENMLGCILSWWSWILSWDLASCWARKGEFPRLGTGAWSNAEHVLSFFCWTCPAAPAMQETC